VGKFRDELEGRQLSPQGKRKSNHYLCDEADQNKGYGIQVLHRGNCQTHQMKKKRKSPRGLRLLGAIVTEGIRINDLKLNIFELKKEYEVHASFENDKNIKHRLDVAVSYLGEEGYFDKPKEVKIYGKAWGQRSDE